MGLDNRAILWILGSAILRIAIFVALPSIPDFLTEQVEISTPVSSFKRLQEGLFLYSSGISPYDGGIFHQAPLLLAVFELIPASLVFTIVDIINAISLYTIADNLSIPSPRFKKLNATHITAAYLLNPFTILSCLGRTTNAITNATIIQAVLYGLAGNGFGSMFALATGTYLSLYPALLFAPIVLLTRQSDKAGKGSTMGLIAYFLGGFAVLLATTPVFTGNFWEFLMSCYGAQIRISDLAPNMGLWWYFFTEIFDAFRDFFIGVFWLHLLGYVGGLTFRLPNQPLFVITSLLGLIAIFKPYPSVSDISIFFGFLPLYQHLLPLTRYLFIAAAVLLYTTLLGPAFYYLWIYAGSGNANFFYAITLVWSLGLTIMIGDILHAVLRDEWEIERPVMKGKDARRI